MAQPFIAEIIMFGGNFAPRSWSFCNGQLLAISSNSALFSILGTTFGGDGRTSFGLPDLRGRLPVHAGNGPGLTDRRLGSKGGLEDVTLNVTQIPSHNHNAQVNINTLLHAEIGPATSNNPEGNMIASHTGGNNGFSPYNTNADKAMAPQGTRDGGSTMSLDNTGGNLAHVNEQPYSVVNFIIALQGIYPSRS